jgi:hypothetical protein
MKIPQSLLNQQNQPNKLNLLDTHTQVLPMVLIQLAHMVQKLPHIMEAAIRNRRKKIQLLHLNY